MPGSPLVKGTSCRRLEFNFCLLPILVEQPKKRKRNHGWICEMTVRTPVFKAFITKRNAM